MKPRGYSPQVFLHATLVVAFLLNAAFPQQSAEAFGVGVGSARRVFVSTPSKHPARLVKECMTPVSQVQVLHPHESVDEAIAKLLSFGLSGAPVVDMDTGNLVGVMSAFDVLQKEAGGALLPMEGSSATIEAFADAACKILATSVQDLMTPYPLTITAQLSMRDAASLMTKEHLHRLPVVDKDAKLVGILSSSDVMRDVLGTVRAALPEGHSVPA
jgi:CBS domain-containing protein